VKLSTSTATGRVGGVENHLGGLAGPDGLSQSGHQSTPDARRVRLTALYQQGLSRGEMADELGICPDWVRQLLGRYEVPRAPLYERRYHQAVFAREEEIVAAFLRLRSDTAVAGELGLQVAHVRRLVDAEVPEAGVLRRARRTLSQAYTDEELLAALRKAAVELPSPMAIEPYRRWARERCSGDPWPSPEIVALRFGGWRRALVRAGLPANSRRGPQATYDYATVVQAVAAAWRDLREYPSVARYDAWRTGRPQFPAAATARRLVRSWDELLVAAYPLVYRPAIGDASRSQPAN
jgi:hypothetical protein